MAALPGVEDRRLKWGGACAMPPKIDRLQLGQDNTAIYRLTRGTIGCIIGTDNL